MRKVLIADGSEEFCLALAENLQGEYQVCFCQNGQSVMEMLRKFAPDVLVLDLMLPGLDGLTLLEMAQEEGIRPVTLAITGLVNEYVTESLKKFNVGYLMVKPCDLKAVKLRVADFVQRMAEETAPAKTPRMKTSDMLIELGMPTKLKGFACAWEGVLLLSQDISQPVTKELYPAVAKIFGSSVQQVERAIRNAIESAWKKRDDKTWKRFFPADARGEIPKPTNAEFLTRLAHMLETER